MPTSADPTAVYDVAASLLACAVAAVDGAEGGGGPVARSCVVWGGIVWENCECGQLVVSVARQAPSSNFPQEGGLVTDRCGPRLWLVTYAVEILRCSPDGDPPPCDLLDAAARSAAIDAWAVRNGVSCCLAAMKRDLQPNGAPAIVDYLVRDQPSVGPLGQCVGSNLTVVVGLRNCLCSETAS